MTSYELQARTLKAGKIALAIQSRNIPAAVVKTFDDQRFWRMYEALAKVNPASAATRAMVVEMLEEAEKPQFDADGSPDLGFGSRNIRSNPAAG